MRIAVIGTGHIGGTLGARWLAAGHEVVYGGRSARADGPGGEPVVTVADALAGADVVLFAVPGPAVADVAAANAAALDGKVVIDATNRVGQAEVNNRTAIMSAAPGAHYARAFNSLAWESFAEPPAGADLFFAADQAARSVTEDLIGAVGLEPAFVGDASAAATVDGVALLWFALVQQSGGNRRLAFRVLR
jgi:8-hydroxy-5-deazaflavin:NADPH oxidoreductase